TSDLLRTNPVTGPFCRAIETDEERKARLTVIGLPMARGRHDLVEHFAVSAGLCALIGPVATETVGFLKERQDAQQPSGFSFADYQADLAGIVFAARLRESQITLASVAAGFTVEQFLPAIDGLAEKLSWKDFTEQYGSFTDERFQKVRTTIGRRIADLSSK